MTNMRARNLLPVTERPALRDIGRYCLLTLQLLAFWTAVILPAIYLPLLIAAGVTALDPTPALALMGLHAVVLILGHQGTPEQRERRASADGSQAGDRSHRFQ